MQYTNCEILRISKETNNFYNTVSESFSQSRNKEWSGWNLCISHFNKFFNNHKSLNLCDIACGNLRFEKFLSLKFPNNTINVNAYDNCDKLLQKFNLDNININYHKTDIISALLNNNLILSNNSNIFVAFGFLHHIPGYNTRLMFLNTLFKTMHYNDICIISFWQIGKSDKILKKAKVITPLAKEKLMIKSLEDNDYFLNWQNDNNVFRYCHDFTDSEIDIIKKTFSIKIIDTFNADGSNNQLNKYLVIQK